MKTQVRQELSKCYRNHWINAFMVLKYDEKLSDKENLKLFFDWVYSINWEDTKKELDKKNINYKNWSKW